MSWIRRLSTGDHDGWSLQGQLAWQLTLAIGLLFGGLFLILDALVDRAMYARLDQFLPSSWRLSIRASIQIIRCSSVRSRQA